jgi:hypothetical protein
MSANDGRDRLFWRVVANAMTKPLNVVALCVLIAAAIVLSPWVLAAAVPVYGLLVVATVRDPAEAERLAAAAERRGLPAGGRSLAGVTGDLRLRVLGAFGQEKAILAELDKLAVAPEGMREQVVKLCDELLDVARRASDVDLYLRTVDVDALRRRAQEYHALGQASDRARSAAAALDEQAGVVEDLVAKRQALDEEIDHVEASLGTIRARIVQARSETGGATDMASDVTDLRERMRVLAESLSEAYGHNDASTPMKGT